MMKVGYQSVVWYRYFDDEEVEESWVRGSLVGGEWEMQ